MVGIHHLTQNNQASNKTNLSEFALTKGAGKVESEQGQTKDKYTEILTNKNLQMFSFEIYKH